jgi:predicted RNA-binding protein with PIN domain
VSSPDVTLYLFDGYNLLRAGALEETRELVDALAGYVALVGARGIVVFDGVGNDIVVGSLEVRYAPNADALLERLAAQNRATERVLLVTSDLTLANSAGDVAKRSSQGFLHEMERVEQPSEPRPELGDRLDDETRERLERLRRGE